ncbi:oxidoreductase [Thioalkalivibrio denitrificans]|uniref:Oxidoreductase n=1 Tax=Thioalkalivibrio denitrificans TaxID=108003 RepID=A0A1V3NHY9_9GAMM|nr:proton-conducting transporter membrane subunit [Thioalkalivibrio denitrificans]OOG24727.1 oxidoreductase [Thioalkalivibrio denitrificans]
MNSLIGADWAAWSVIAPLAGAVLAALWPRSGPLLGMVVSVFAVLVSAGAALGVWHDGPARAGLGGWEVPLGIALHLDGLSALMLLMTAVVGFAVSVYALAYIRPGSGRDKFWPLWLWLWASMNGLYLSGDAFNLYVALELLGLAAVAMVALAGGAAALTAAMRYLLVSLLGSLAYLMGVALLYASHGVLDLALLGQVMGDEPATRLAAALMTAGLLMKTALFPLHVWLAPAHGSAPAPVSAVLSALVVKASFYLILRLWLDVFPQPEGSAFALLMGALGAAALLWGSLLALRAQRLKRVVAYSTVAQLGYLLLAFPLMLAVPAAWHAVVFFALAHACAKAAVFMAAGSLQRSAGHDRLAGLGGVMRREPMTLFALGIAGASLVGLPLTGGFIAKWLLVEAAIQGQAWGWALLVLVGGLLSGAYVFRVLGHGFIRDLAVTQHHPVPALMSWSVLALALVSVALGFAGAPALELLTRHGGEGS